MLKDLLFQEEVAYVKKRRTYYTRYQEVSIAQKRGKIKTFIFTLILLALVAVVFILLGGGDMLKSAGKKLEGAGKQADQIKDKMEKTGEETKKTIEKTVEKGLEKVKPGEKK